MRFGNKLRKINKKSRSLKYSCAQIASWCGNTALYPMAVPLKVIAVIPAYNEGRTIRSVIRSLRPCVSEVVVVDDQSGDTTPSEAAAAGAIVLRHEPNLGY